jgi:TonB family protein
MKLVISLAIAGVMAAAPLTAAPAPQPTQSQVKNWEVLLKLYPRRALEAHEQGTVAFNVTLDQEGLPTACNVTASSGHPLLDQETCNLVVSHALFKPVTDASGRKVTRTLAGQVDWRLPTGGAPAPAPTVLAEGAGPEKMICKKIQKTGSLASFERTCMTAMQWDKARLESTEPWGDVQGKKGSSNGH